MTNSEHAKMQEWEVRFQRNKGIFHKSRGSAQPTILGDNKQFPEIKKEIIAQPGYEMEGILSKNKLCQNKYVKELINNRRARVNRHNQHDVKSFLTAEDRARIFGKIDKQSLKKPAEEGLDSIKEEANSQL